MKFIDQLYHETRQIQEDILKHPFPNKIGDGTLPMQSFKYFIEQDYLFLLDYAKILGLAAIKSPDRHIMKAFSELLLETISTEMELHIQFCSKLGIMESDLIKADKAESTTAYTNFLVRTGYEGSFEEVVAALVPCMATYSQIGILLESQASPNIPDEYREWISMYSSEEFKQLANWITDLINELGELSDERVLGKMAAAYESSCAHELNFWTMCINY
jgi:thiaminase (transcriptional activator TenA)